MLGPALPTVVLCNPVTNADMIVTYIAHNERNVEILSVFDGELGDVVLSPTVAYNCMETIRGLVTERAKSAKRVKKADPFSPERIEAFVQGITVKRSRT